MDGPRVNNRNNYGSPQPDSWEAQNNNRNNYKPAFAITSFQTLEST